jgi:glycerophosphoryl diester phosphodiesterase
MLNGERFYLDRPLVLAHRGARAAAPENTLAAFAAAAELGADGVELDVTRCASGEIVVLHDDTVDRTSNGSGPVAALPFYALRELDAGAWFEARFAGQRIPLLSEALDLAGDTGLRVNIEIKGRSWRGDGIEEEIAAMVRQRHQAGRVIISSFNPPALMRMRRAAPALPVALLYAADMPLHLARGWARYAVRLGAMHPHYGMVDAAYVSWAHGRGYRVNPWTVNEPADIERLIGLGVDGIIGDYPERIREALGL